MRKLRIEEFSFGEEHGGFMWKARDCEDPEQEFVIYGTGREFEGDGRGLIMGRYKHFKGGEYDVLGIGDWDNKQVVVYQALYNSNDFSFGQVWIRSLDNFVGFKEKDGQKIKRFEYVGK